MPDPSRILKGFQELVLFLVATFSVGVFVFLGFIVGKPGFLPFLDAFLYSAFLISLFAYVVSVPLSCKSENGINWIPRQVFVGISGLIACFIVGNAFSVPSKYWFHSSMAINVLIPLLLEITALIFAAVYSSLHISNRDLSEKSSKCVSDRRDYTDMLADLEFIDDPELKKQLKKDWLPGLIQLVISDPVTALKTVTQRFRTR
jgi:hypothetical protein